MKNTFKKLALAISLPIIGFIAFNANAQTPGPEHCSIFCESSTIYHCIITNTVTGQQYTCTFQQVKGTKTETVE